MTVGGTAGGDDRSKPAQGQCVSRSDRGATDAECTFAEGQEFSAHVRMRSLETLKDAGSRLRSGLRVLRFKRSDGATPRSTSADARRGLQMVKSALEITRGQTEDPFADLPDTSELGSFWQDNKCS